MTTVIPTPQTAPRGRRADRTTPVFPSGAAAPAAPAARGVSAGESIAAARTALEDALRVTTDAAAEARSEARRCEAERRRAARILELDLPPRTLTEEERTRRRETYAGAARAVELARADHERAQSHAAAVRLVLDALDLDAPARRDVALAILASHAR